MARKQHQPGRAIQPGDDVHGADGEKIGTVGAVTSTYLLVEQGFFFPTDSYIPRGAVAAVDDGKVYLTVTKEEALHQGWEAVPSREPARVTTISRGESFTDGETDTVTVPVHVEELTVTKTRREVGGIRIEKRVVVDEVSLESPVTELRVMVVRRAVQRPGAEASAEGLEEVIVDVPLANADRRLDPEGRLIEEIAIRTEVVNRIERVSRPLRREQVTVTKVGEGVVAGELDDEAGPRALR